MTPPTPLDRSNDHPVPPAAIPANSSEPEPLLSSKPIQPADTDTPNPHPSSISESVDSLACEAITAANLSDRAHQPINDLSRKVSNPQRDPTLDTSILGSAFGVYQVIALVEPMKLTTRYRAANLDDPAHVFTLELFPFTTSDQNFLNQCQSTPAIQFAARRHPGIAAPIEAGITAQSQPYLVVETADGLPIDAHCDHLQLNVATRLKLFAQVCDVIHFAHKHAVIHRDLKPANILITDSGAPMIMGFGIADLYASGSHPVSAASHSLSSANLVIDDNMLDLDFSSPEQVTGEPITTAVDIYALGVTLYRLLTGHSPYRLENSSRTEISQAIIQQIAEKPSKSLTQGLARALISPEVIAANRATSVARLKHTLSGDLDAIVLKTLRKEPELRYASALHLADDIRAFLRGLPVHAQRESRTYQLRNFLRRHVAMITVAVMLPVVLLSALLLKNAALISTRRERDQANALSIESRQTIDQVYRHITDNRLLDQFNLRPLRKTLLEDAQRFYQAILDQPPTPLSEPAELAEAATRVAKLTAIIASPTAAVSHFELARSLWEQLVAQEPTNKEYQRNLATLLTDFATTIMPLEAKLETARQSLQQAQKRVDALLAANPRSIPDRRQQASIFLAQALILDQERHPNEAIASITNALTIYDQLQSDDPDTLETLLSIANAHAYAGFILASQPAEQLEAIAAYKRAIESRQRILTTHPDFDEQSHRLAIDQNSLANCLQRTSQTDLALQALRRSRDLFEQLQARYPDLRPFQLGKATDSSAIAELLHQRNETTEAFTFAREAEAGLLRLHSRYPQDATVRIHLAKNHNIMGRLFERTGKKAEAMRSFQQAIDLYEIMMPNLDPASIYELACNISLCIPLINQSLTQSPSPFTTRSLERRRGFYAKRAIEALHLAGRSGFLNADMLDTNNDLDPLRHDPDFQQTLKDIQNHSISTDK